LHLPLPPLAFILHFSKPEYIQGRLILNHRGLLEDMIMNQPCKINTYTELYYIDNCSWFYQCNISTLNCQNTYWVKVSLDGTIRNHLKE
jgi:hypothetical protein